MTELVQENVEAPAEPARLAPLPSGPTASGFLQISVSVLKVWQLPSLRLPQVDASAMTNLHREDAISAARFHPRGTTGELSKAQILRKLRQYPEDGWLLPGELFRGHRRSLLTACSMDSQEKKAVTMPHVTSPRFIPCVSSARRKDFLRQTATFASGCCLQYRGALLKKRVEVGGWPCSDLFECPLDFK